MAVRIIVVAEADADRRIACGLVDRKLLHHAPEWWGEGQLDAERTWIDLQGRDGFSRWAAIPDLFNATFPSGRPRYVGFRSGDRRQGFDYASVRKALQICAQMSPLPEVILLVRDLDKQVDDRRASIALAAEDTSARQTRVVLALPNPKREAWVLNGFIPEDDREIAALDDLRAGLGFDPCENGEKLTASTRDSKRDAKRVLGVLSGDDRRREEKCWSETKWSVLRRRGAGTGLNSFLEDVKQRLLPLIHGRAASE